MSKLNWGKFILSFAEMGSVLFYLGIVMISVSINNLGLGVLSFIGFLLAGYVQIKNKIK